LICKGKGVRSFSMLVCAIMLNVLLCTKGRASKTDILYLDVEQEQGDK
jgi:hypothetical protein